MERTLNHLTTLQELRVTILGAGNVATHLAKTFSQQGAVLQIYNHNIAGAKTLAETIGATYTASLDEIWPDADLCIISVKDDAVAGLAHSLAGHGGVWAHTSGSVEMEALAPISDSYGVFYPMQTFSKSMDVDMTEVPFFIEGSTEATTEFLKGIASQLSHKVYETDSHRRALLHIAAVFACNFTNRLWDISASVLKEAGLRFDIMRPLVEATLDKAVRITPHEGQTGPARRNDRSIIDKHTSLLGGEARALYTMLSESIIRQYHPDTNEQNQL